MATSIAWPLLAPFALWASATPVARLMVGSMTPTEARPPVDLEQVQVAAISVAGLLLVFYTVPSLLAQLFVLYEGSRVVSGLGVDRRVFNTSLLVGVIAHSVTLVLGLVLMTTPRFWVALLRRVREQGLPPQGAAGGAGGAP